MGLTWKLLTIAMFTCTPTTNRQNREDYLVSLLVGGYRSYLWQACTGSSVVHDNYSYR
jgi:hypothetical protein